jgi:beta-mannosidase
MSGFVEVAMLLDDHVVVGRGEKPITVAARGTVSVAATEVLGGFHDLNHAYRFGPASHDVVVATLFDAERRVVSEAYHFVRPSVPAPCWDVDLKATAREAADGSWKLSLRSNRFLHSVSVDVEGFLADDDWFHLPPDRDKTVILKPNGDGAKFGGSIEALNLQSPVRIETENAS